MCIKLSSYEIQRVLYMTLYIELKILIGTETKITSSTRYHDKYHCYEVWSAISDRKRKEKFKSD